MLVVGLTGGIATGKSTVSAQLKAHGVPVIDADVLARDAVAPGTRGLRAIAAAFGPGVLLDDGSLNRPALGQIIFNDEAKRRTLNGIVHPAVRRAMLWAVVKHWAAGARACVLDVPLLIESGIWRWVGKVVVVYCSQEIQLRRLMERDGSTREAAGARVRAQMGIADKLAYADAVLDNSGPPGDLAPQVDALVRRLQRDAGWSFRLSWIPPVAVASALLTLFWRAVKHSRRARRERRKKAKAGGQGGEAR